MEQVTVAPPPLPPKTRRAPPDAPTVLSTSNNLNYSNRYPEVDTAKSHVVKIRINPENNTRSSVICEVAPCIRISVNNSNDMVQNPVTLVEERSNYFFYNCMSSGQVSPSDTLDSGTCSDLDGTPPPLPKKKSSGVSVTLIGGCGGGDGVGQHKRASSLTSSGAEIDSDDNESNLSCDSLNSGKISPIINNKAKILPQTLLHDIRQRNAKLTTPLSDAMVKSYQERKEEKLQQKQQQDNKSCVIFETDMFYNFHLNEHISEPDNIETTKCSSVVEDETFAGYKDLLGDGASTIRSAKGTVRGVKNRVRAGIATFLQINSNIKTYKEKDAGKVVVYTTTMGILRETYQACMKVKQILRTLLVKFEERDVFMSNDYQMEIRDRMRCDQVLVPQVFVDGQHIGDAETVERLNESGELRRILKPYKSMDACTTCQVCGGYRLLPCQVCNGSKKSVHRNHFTTEFVALKCMNCDEVGLVRCSAC